MTGIPNLLRSAIGITSADGTRRTGRQEAYESFLSGVAVQGLLLITGILAARILGEEGRGQQALIWIVALTAVQVGMLGLPVALTYEVAKGRATVQQLLKHITSIAFAQIALVVISYSALMVLVFDDRVPLSAAVVTIAALPAMVWQTYGLALVQGKHRFRALHVLRLLPSTFYAVGLGAGAIFLGGSVLMVMSTWTLAYLIAAVITQLYVRRISDEGIGASVVLPEKGKMVRFGAVGFLGASSPMETFRVDQLAVGIILTTGDLALYTTALAFCNLPRFLNQALALVAYARIAGSKRLEERRKLLRRYTFVGVSVAIVVSLPLVVFAGPLIELTFGPDFSGAVQTTQILLGATVILCARRILSDCLRGFGLPGAGSVAEIASLVSLVPAILLLVPRLGLEGFAFAMAVSYTVGLAVLMVYFLRNHRADSAKLAADDPTSS